MIETAERVKVDLLGGCGEPGCLKMAAEMRMKLDTPRYRDGVSVMAVPASLEEWRAQHRTARKRADRCKRLGYEFGLLDRSEFAADILAINTSLSHRQSRPMSEGYFNPSTSRLPEYPCQLHAIRSYGVFETFALSSPLRAYLTLHRINELALVSMILGHGAHLTNDIMFALFEGVVAAQAELGGQFYYNRFDSGGPGLRYFKTKLGFVEAGVEWRL